NPVDGTCRTACATVIDCAPGFVCQEGKCASPPPVSQGKDASCSIAPGSPAGSGGAPSLVALGLVALELLRRHRTRSRAVTGRALPSRAPASARSPGLS